MSYDATQRNARLVACSRCAAQVYATHPTDPYVCIACRREEPQS